MTGHQQAIERRIGRRAILAVIAAYAFVLQVLMLSALPVSAAAGHAGALCRPAAAAGQTDPERSTDHHDLCCLAACAGPSLAALPHGGGTPISVAAPVAASFIYPAHRRMGMASSARAAASARGPPTAA